MTIKKTVRFKALQLALKHIQQHTRLQLELTQLDGLHKIYFSGQSGITVTDLARHIGISNSAAGRMAATFSDSGFSRTKMAGYGLCEAFTDYSRPAFKMIRCTLKGNTVVEEYLAILER